MHSKLNHSEEDLVNSVLINGIGILRFCETTTDLSLYSARVRDEVLPYPTPPLTVNTAEWLIPKAYRDLDIEAYCLSCCKTEAERDRVLVELTLYRELEMFNVLRSIKYVIDVFRENNIVWGVGRGSSVASYCLYLLGVHKVDSIKYNLPLEEFFK